MTASAYDHLWKATQAFHDSIGAADPLAEVKADPAVLFRANGMEPDPAQIELLNCRDRNVLVLWTRQFAGKALEISTPIVTPKGWTTMGHLRIGDEVFDETGRPVKVTNCSEVSYRTCYRVRFSDRSEIVADAEHLWTVIDRPAIEAIKRQEGQLPEEWWSWQSYGRGNGSRPAARTVTTSSILKTGLKERRGLLRFSIPTTQPLQLPKAHLLAEPYALGAWLGDGSKQCAILYSADKEIFAEVGASGYSIGKALSPRTTFRNKCQGRTIGTRFHVALRMLGLLNDKHIPEAYLRANPDQRLALLQGLMDTDGYVSSNGFCEFTNTNRRIAEGFAELAVSLGLTVRVIEKRAMLEGRDCGPNWRISFFPWFQPFRLKRKVDRVRLLDKVRRKLRFIESIEPAGIQPVRCIAVETPSRLYLAGRGMLPTHNSQVAATIALHNAMTNLGHQGRGSTTLVFSSAQRESIELLRKVRFLRYGLLHEHTSRQGSKSKWRPKSISKEVKQYNRLIADNGTWNEDNLLPPELDAVSDAQTMIELENGSRIISLPARSQSIVGYSVDLLILDEAKIIPDDLYNSVRPMMAMTKGRMIALTTPLGQRGWFWEAWKKCDDAKLKGEQEPYRRFKRTCWECPRLDKDFVALERQLIGEYWFKQEYEITFLDPIGAIFRGEDIERAMKSEEKPYEVPW